jgi:hypothetical protein
LQKKLTQLEESLKEGYSKVVEIEFAYHVGELFPNVDSGEEIVEYIDDPTARQHAWVDAMDKFRGALASMLPPLYSSKNRVRVRTIIMPFQLSYLHTIPSSTGCAHRRRSESRECRYVWKNRERHWA